MGESSRRKKLGLTEPKKPKPKKQQRQIISHTPIGMDSAMALMMSLMIGRRRRRLPVEITRGEGEQSD
jgi:hypothetical protein